MEKRREGVREYLEEAMMKLGVKVVVVYMIVLVNLEY